MIADSGGLEDMAVCPGPSLPLSTVRPCKSQLAATAPGRTARCREWALAWGHVLRLRSKSNCFCQQWCVAPCIFLPTL